MLSNNYKSKKESFSEIFNKTGKETHKQLHE